MMSLRFLIAVCTVSLPKDINTSFVDLKAGGAADEERKASEARAAAALDHAESGHSDVSTNAVSLTLPAGVTIQSRGDDAETNNAKCGLLCVVFSMVISQLFQIGIIATVATIAVLVLKEATAFEVEDQDDIEKEDRKSCKKVKDVAIAVSIFNLLLVPLLLIRYCVRKFTKRSESDEKEPCSGLVGLLHSGLGISLIVMFSIAGGLHFWSYALAQDKEIGICGAKGEMFISICWWQFILSIWMVLIGIGGLCLCIPCLMKGSSQDGN
jgi:hypothetical protein